MAVLTATNAVVLHSKGLTIDAVKVNDAVGSFELDADYELLTISKTDNSVLNTGNASIEIEFNGDMKNRIVGLYTSSYMGSNGENR